MEAEPYFPHEKTANSSIFMTFRPLRRSQKLSGGPPEASPGPGRRPVRTRNRPCCEILHFPFVKRPFFEASAGTWGHLTKPQPPAPVVIFLDPTLYHSLYRTQLADAPGSADSEGLRPHAPTLEKRSQPNVSFTQNPKLELNPKLQIERPH